MSNLVYKWHCSLCHLGVPRLCRTLQNILYRAFVFLVRQCARLLSPEAARIKLDVKLLTKLTKDHYLKSFWNIHSWPHPITNSHRKLPWRRFCETRTQNLAILGKSQFGALPLREATAGRFNMFEHVSNEVNSHRLCIMHLKHQALGQTFDPSTLQDFARMQLRYYMRDRLVTIYCMTTQCDEHTVNQCQSYMDTVCSSLDFVMLVIFR